MQWSRGSSATPILKHPKSGGPPPVLRQEQEMSASFLTLDCFQERLWGQPKVLLRGLNELLLHQAKPHKRIFALEYSLELHLKTANAAIGTCKRSSKVNKMLYWGILSPNHVNQRNIFSKIFKSVPVAMATYLSIGGAWEISTQWQLHGDKVAELRTSLICKLRFK